MTAEAAGRQKKGKVVSVQGPVVDVKFADINDMPDLHETISTRTFDRRDIILLVAEHLEGNIARCVSLASTLNLQRNAVATASGETLKVPVGDELFGRIVNVMGETPPRWISTSTRWRAARRTLLRPASKSWICCSPWCAAARPASSAAPVAAKPS
jgi:F0F1-type ATP synthase beta subunit